MPVRQISRDDTIRHHEMAGCLLDAAFGRGDPHSRLGDSTVSTQVRDRVATVSDELAEFIITALQWDGAKEDLLADEPVELPEILDSADLLELAGFLEDNYGIEISDEEVVAETFASVAILAQIVVAKQAALNVEQ